MFDSEFFVSSSSSMKWTIVVLLGILFIVFASRGAFNLTNSLYNTMSGKTFFDAQGCPSFRGVLLHAVLFGIVIRLILW